MDEVSRDCMVAANHSQRRREPWEAQRLRRPDRHPTKLHAALYFRATFQPVIICDLSIDGAGLSGTPSMLPGENVTMRLINGRCLKATVRWWAQGKCGVTLSEQLEPSDPLLQLALKKKE